MAEKRARPEHEDRTHDPLEDESTDFENAEFEPDETDSDDEDVEDLDEEVVDEGEPGQDRELTDEIGSEGGSTGSLEERRAQSGMSRGSEATETGRPSGDNWKARPEQGPDNAT